MMMPIKNKKVKLVSIGTNVFTLITTVNTQNLKRKHKLLAMSEFFLSEYVRSCFSTGAKTVCI